MSYNKIIIGGINSLLYGYGFIYININIIDIYKMENIVLSIYYTNYMDPQRNIHQKKNNFAYIKNFYESIARNNMNAVIFHDGLSQEFIEKYQNKNITFALIPNESYGLTSMNDIRFMIYLDYLKKHNNINKVIISDAADVEFYCNVFDDFKENKLYVCYDRDRTFHHYYLQDRIKLTYLSIQPFIKIMDQKAIQAGLFGGSYEMVLKCLEFIKYEFDNLVDKNYNTNYIVYNHVVYNNMLEHSVFSKDGNDIKTKAGKKFKYLTWK
ncbi:hypothetical protein QJ856_gp0851 [Tupanvirus deep ocean]|uniref:Uncharacterized protein n=2 Tax=Tupanvirus TaxID=2094720 RepID=A0AC62A861_9VIRU|nr:hypothetical protein QJ856_gp0851 [Tupanvirus deep ocean]QKU33904.1 hypothetical protein [Tupanvirus deep ocean]